MFIVLGAAKLATEYLFTRLLNFDAWYKQVFIVAELRDDMKSRCVILTSVMLAILDST